MLNLSFVLKIPSPFRNILFQNPYTKNAMENAPKALLENTLLTTRELKQEIMSFISGKINILSLYEYTKVPKLGA